MKNHNFFLFTNKNDLLNSKSKLKSLFLGLLILFAYNQITAKGYTETVNSNKDIAPCPSTPITAKKQIICQFDTVETLVATVDPGTTLLWYKDATGGTPLKPTETLIPGNYYAAAVNADGSCESPRKLLIVATNNALAIDGASDRVTLTSKTIKDAVTEFTMEAWIKPDDSNFNGGYHAIFGAVQNGGNNTRNPSVYLHDGGTVHIDSYKDVTLDRYDYLTTPTTPPLIKKSVWTHIAFVKFIDPTSSTGSTYNFYVNGVLAFTRTAPLKVNVRDVYSFGRVDNNYSGLLDEIRFWSVARTQKEIQDNMQVNLVGTEPGLIDYFTFDQGIANGDNTAISTAFDSADTPGPTPPPAVYDGINNGENNGDLFDITRNGTISNFVKGYFPQILGPSSTVAVGETLQLTHASAGGGWSITPDDDSIATVDISSGLVTGVKGGQAVVSYNFCGFSTTYPITVIPNENPTISTIADQNNCPGASVDILSFKVGDNDTPAEKLVVTATSSNPTLIPNDLTGIVLGGSGVDRTIKVTPVTGQTGETTISITVADTNTGTTTKTFKVSFLDATPPTVKTKNITALELDASGNATITPSLIDNGSNDSCGAVKLISVTPSSFTCADIAKNEVTVTLTVEDSNGNVATGTATVTITDTTKPTVTTKPKTVVLDATGNAIISADDIDNGSKDNCSINTRILSKTSFTCNDLGANQVELTVTDVNGNEASEFATVTVTEAIAPTVITKNIEITLDTTGNASITANQLDNGSSDNCTDSEHLTFTASKYDFNCNNVGANTVQLFVKDKSGNISLGADAIVTVISKGCELEVSQAITPNGDGINDTWVINGIEGHPSAIVRVFNRWGNEVFYSSNYKNDWNGHYKNFENDLPSSSGYYYQIDLDDNGTIDNQGWLYITK